MVTDKSKSIGHHIRMARQEKGLSVEELAQTAGCSDEYLEWVESGQVEPPVALLLQLARSMQMDSSTFLHVQGSPAQRLEESAKRTENYSYTTLTPAEVDKHLMAFLVTIPPKTAHGGVGYRHEGEEFVYVLSGELEITVEKKKKKLGARESLRFNSNLNHNLSNPGDKDTEFLVVLYVP